MGREEMKGMRFVGNHREMGQLREEARCVGERDGRREEGRESGRERVSEGVELSFPSFSFLLPFPCLAVFVLHLACLRLSVTSLVFGKKGKGHKSIWNELGAQRTERGLERRVPGEDINRRSLSFYSPPPFQCPAVFLHLDLDLPIPMPSFSFSFPFQRTDMTKVMEGTIPLSSIALETRPGLPGHS